MVEPRVLSKVVDGAALIELNRPQALNALNSELLQQLADALDVAEADPNVACIIITGSERAFAAGADIAEMSGPDFPDTYIKTLIDGPWTRLARCTKPTIAAVQGYALGGGCELAMMCDILVAGENAHFGQPEITLALIPGIGGTQRLVRAVGKAQAMDMILTGRRINAEEALACGLAARVVADDLVVEEALEMARVMAKLSAPALAVAKAAVNQAFELSLQDGLELEKRLFRACFDTQDQSEGMAAFLEKRVAEFKNQ